MITHFSISQFDEAAAAIRARTRREPRIAIILGSGLSAVADAVVGAEAVPYSEIPHFATSTVIGHSGRLVLGELHSKSVMLMQGRVHFYEGYGMAQVTLPIRVMQRLGIEILIVTNAAGGVNPQFVPGDVMLITDHLSFLGMMGHNPLIGPNYDEIGPRFPDMSQPYDRELAELARQTATEARMTLREGVYAGISGPSFEAPAEVRFLRLAGADAVGMSTVHEVIVARHGGMRVLGMSGISNKTSMDGSNVTTHEEVIEAGKTIGPKVEGLIAGVLRRL
jgi:purine-nucleoside phosphorylase